MAGLARRLAPAAALGGLAVIIVGVADPAIANLRSGQDAIPEAAPSVSTPSSQSGTAVDPTAPEQSTVDQTAPEQSTADQTAPDQTAPAQESQQLAAGSGDCSNAEQVAGDSSMTPWGPVQVVATVDNGTVCQVQAVAWPDNDRKSAMINDYAIPILDQSATESGATRLDFVSGATYTSNGYAQSLQSILDQM